MRRCCGRATTRGSGARSPWRSRGPGLGRIGGRPRSLSKDVSLCRWLLLEEGKVWQKEYLMRWRKGRVWDLRKVWSEMAKKTKGRSMRKVWKDHHAPIVWKFHGYLLCLMLCYVFTDVALLIMEGINELKYDNRWQECVFGFPWCENMKISWFLSQMFYWYQVHIKS